jgi:anti-sigma-K factor RskA
MNRRDDDLHSIAGAYALDALSDDERAQFEQHLSGCSDCADEVGGFHETTARLAVATAAQPPPALRARTLAAAVRTPQLAPLLADRASSRTARVAAAFRGRTRAIAAVVACTVVAAAVAIGITLATTRHQVRENPSHDKDVAAVLNAPDAVVMKAPISTGGTATVVMSHQMKMLVFTAAGLKPLPAAKGYQLWLLHGGRRISAGMLPAAHAGATMPMTAHGAAAGDRLGLSVEPAHGSSAPSSPMLVELLL